MPPALGAETRQQRTETRARIVVGQAMRQRRLGRRGPQGEKASGDAHVERRARQLVALGVLDDLRRDGGAFAHRICVRPPEIDPHLARGDFRDRAGKAGHALADAGAVDAADQTRRARRGAAIIGEDAIAEHGAAACAPVARQQDFQGHAGGRKPRPCSICAVSNNGRPTTLL